MHNTEHLSVLGFVVIISTLFCCTNDVKQNKLEEAVIEVDSTDSTRFPAALQPIDTIAYAPGAEHLQFQRMQAIDTIYNQKIIDSIPNKQNIKGTDIFLTDEFAGALNLVDKHSNSWIVYDYNGEFGSNLTVSKPKYIDKEYVSVDVVHTPSASSFKSYYGHYILINYKDKTFASVWTSSFEGDGFNCKADVSFRNLILTIKNRRNGNKQYCAESGRFKLVNKIFVPLKR